MKILEIERILVRPFTLADIADLHREVYAPEVWGPRTRKSVRDGVAMAVLMSQSADDAPWAKRAVVLKEPRTLIGQVRLGPSHNYFYRWADEPNPRFNAVEVELSFAFGVRWWGQSYAFEASTAMIDYAFRELKLPRLVGGTGSDNVRSIALHRRLGYQIFPAYTECGEPAREGIVAVLNNTQV